MRRLQGPLAFLSLLLAGCGLGTAGAVGASGGGGDGSANTATSLTAFRLESTKEAPALLRFVLTDGDADPASVEFLYSLPGQGLRPITALPGGTGNPATLATSAAGIDHAIPWSFPSEALLPGDGSFVEGVTVFASVEGSRDLVPGANAAELGLGNDAPAIGPVHVPVGPSGEEDDIVLVELTVSDTSDDLVSVRAEYSAEAPAFPPGSWTPAKPAGPGIGDVVASAAGTDVAFFWDTEADIGSSFDGDVRVRFTADDGVSAGAPGASADFRVDNNSEPIAILQGDLFVASQDRRGGIPVPYTVIDDEGDPVEVVFQWRRRGEVFPELPEDRAKLEALLADPVRRRELQVATEVPSSFEGRAVAVDATRVRLPELASTASHLLGGDPASLVGRRVELLRPSSVPLPLDAPAHGWDLVHPVAALPVGDGLTILVLDRPNAGAWRLRELELTSAAHVRTVATSARGAASAMAFEPDRRSVLVAADVGGDWRVERVRLTDGAVELLAEPGAAVERGTVRGIAALGSGRTLVTVGSSLILLDHLHLGSTLATHAAPEALGGPTRSAGTHAAPLSVARAVPLHTDLAEPWGVVADPLHTNGAYLALRGAHRVVHLRLDTGAAVPVVAASTAFGVAIPAPEALALEHGGSRLLVVTDALPGDGFRELRGIDLRGGEGHELFELALLPGDVGGLASGPDGLRLATLSDRDDLAVGGGLSERRTVAAYDERTQVASLTPPLAGDVPPETGWRVRGGAPLTGGPGAGRQAVFVWDSRDAGGEAFLRATPRDDERGTASETLAPKEVRWERELLELEDPGPTDAAGGVVAGDLDGDGDLDIAVAYSLDQTLKVYFQEERGRFGSTPLVLGGPAETPFPFALAAADLDGDDDLDLVTGNTGDHTLAIFFQEGPGVFGTAPLVIGGPPVLDTPGGIVVADLDGDTDLDLVVASTQTDSLVIFFQDPAGSFGAPPLELGGTAETDFPDDVIAADLDGDGDLDLASANSGSDNLAIFFQERPGRSAEVPLELGGAEITNGPRALIAADLDGDGDLDLASVNSPPPFPGTRPTLTVFFQETPGAFRTTPLELFPSRSMLWLSAADLNGDGALDLVSSSAGVGGDVIAFFQEEPGEFAATPVPLHSQGVGSAHTVQDVNGDGRPDVIGNGAQGRVQVLLQHGPGAFLEAPLVIGGRPHMEDPVSIATADLDGDGRLDLVSTNLLSGSLSLFFQEVAGVFRDEPRQIPVGSAQLAVAAADLDGDGDVDLVSAGQGTDTLTVLGQDAPGTFAPRFSLGGPDVTDSPNSVVAADLDSDGDVDLASANLLDDTLTVFFQEAPGAFGPVPLEVGGTGVIDAPFFVVAADLDADGDLDLASVNRLETPVTVFLQEGPGVFTTVPLMLGTPALDPESLAAADLDGDGDVDLVTSDRATDRLRVFYQESPGRFTGHALGGPAFLDLPGTVAIVDVDGNGHPEVVSANFLGNDLTVFFQRSPRRFDPTPLALGVSLPASLLAADVDGDPDLVTGSRGTDDLTIFWGGR